ncbi:MAG: hypothetical protein KAG61_08255 [Bacteriovoracaceae bacterium]|nr:hypothetical protein [Bacteriovoracaceae bacterium]
MEKMNAFDLSIEKRDRIKEKILIKFEEIFTADNFETAMKMRLKDDNSVVTDIDYFVSQLVKVECTAMGLNFFSEEDHGELSFPALVLDPIDGTKELVKGIPECTLSLAIMESKKIEGFGWIYNPFTGFEISTTDKFVPPICRRERTPLGFVSQSEWDDGLYRSDCTETGFSIAPKGSMAHKLFLMAVGGCDFIVSRRPKSLWDIAAGMLILERQGVEFYIGNKRITELDQKLFEGGPLIWTRPECREVVLNHFTNEK